MVIICLTEPLQDGRILKFHILHKLIRIMTILHLLAIMPSAQVISIYEAWKCLIENDTHTLKSLERCTKLYLIQTLKN